MAEIVLENAVFEAGLGYRGFYGGQEYRLVPVDQEKRRQFNPVQVAADQARKIMHLDVKRPDQPDGPHD